jgi:hypothetical protein
VGKKRVKGKKEFPFSSGSRREGWNCKKRERKVRGLGWARVQVSINSLFYFSFFY